MGTVNDQRRRESAQRQANGELDFDILMAREHIFRKGKGVKSAAVEKILGPKSFVPIEVRDCFSLVSLFLTLAGPSCC
jgi:hypothetical protein